MWRGLFFAVAVAALCCFVRTDTAGADEHAATVVKLLTDDLQVAADGNYVETKHIEVLASNDATAMQVGQAKIAYDSELSSIEVVEAHTLKADGTTIPVDATAIYDQQSASQPQPGMVSDLRVKMIVFPQFAAGDTAVFTIQEKSKEPLFPGQFTYGAVFPTTASFEDVRVTITAPASLPLKVETHEAQFDKRASDQNIVYRFHYATPNPPPEAVSTASPFDVLPRFFVSSFKDYADLGRAYAAAAEPKMAVTPKVTALADQITQGVDDRRLQAEKLYDWVSGHIRYVAVELGTGSIVPHDADSIISDGYGDCKDHDVLLRTLLKAKGIDSGSVLINATNSYSLTEAPTLRQLNHVITWLPEFKLYLDSTVAVAPFGVLPFGEYGKPIVYASSTNPLQDTMPVLPPGTASMTTRAVEKLDSQGQLSGTTTTTARGPYAITLRIVGLIAQAAGPTTAAEKLMTAMGYRGAKGELIAFSPLQLQPEYSVTGNFTASGFTEVAAGRSSFVLPGGLRVLGLTGDGLMGPLVPGELKDADPTPCFSAHAYEQVSLEAPPGMKFATVPKDVRVETPNLVFTAHWSLDNDTLTVTREFTSMIAEPLCTGEVRKQSAEALKKIADSYGALLAFEPATATPNVAEATPGATGDSSDFDQRGQDDFSKAQFAEAVADFDQALQINPDDQYARATRAAAKLNLRDFRGAVADLDLAIAHDPNSVLLLLLRAQAQAQLRHYELAIADCNKAIALNPKFAVAYIVRAQAERMLGDNVGANQDTEKALKLDPNVMRTSSN